MKYSYEQKLAAVLSVEHGEHSVLSAVRHFGVSKKPLQRWLGHYRLHGAESLRHQFHSWSIEFKLSVLDYMHQNHLSLFETAIHFGIPSDRTVLQWERLYRAHGIDGLTPKQRGRPPMNKSKTKTTKPKSSATEHELILAENERLRAENAYLKKLRVLVEERIARESGNGRKPSKD